MLFFFSSRRRHTRSLRDWSSDVCSSDLLLVEGGPGLGKSRLLEEAVRLAGRAGVRAAVGRADADDTVVPMGPLMSACFGGNAPLLDRSDLSALRALREDRYWVLLELEALLERAA